MKRWRMVRLLGGVLLVLVWGNFRPVFAQGVICCNQLIDVGGNWIGASRTCDLSGVPPEKLALLCQQLADCAAAAPFCRGGSAPPDEKCQKLWENLRNAMAAEERANDAVSEALERFNSASERVNDAITQRNAAEAKWEDLYTKMTADLPNIQAARERWREVSPRLTSETGISDWDTWNREKDAWFRGEDVASRYSASEFEKIQQDIQNATKNLDYARPLQTRALADLNATQAEWQRAADNFQKASDRYHKECGGGQ